MRITGLLADPDFPYSSNTTVGTGGQLIWPFTFAGGYISRDHVKIKVTDQVGTVVDTDFTWVDDSNIKIEPALPEGYNLVIYRDTPKDAPLVDFADGGLIDEVSLDKNARQAVMLVAESLDSNSEIAGVLSTRAILVPDGETAPAFPPRPTMLGKLVGVNLAGELIGVSTTAGGTPVTDADQIAFDGVTVAAALRDQIEELAQTHDEVVAQATTITDQGLALIDQATSTATLDSALSTLRADHESLVGVVDALSEIGEAGEGLATLIANETSARTTADSAQIATIGVIGARVGETNAFLLDLDQVKVSPTESLGTRLTSINSATGANTAAITAETTARTNAVAAEAASRVALGVSTATNLAAAIGTEQSARVAGDTAEANARTALAATLRGETTAAVAAEASARVTADVTEASARSSLAATLRDETTAAVLIETNARITAVSAEASARTALGATMGANVTAQVAAEASARASADSAITSTMSLIGASAGGGTSFQLDLSKVLVDGGQAIGTRLAGITSSFAATNAAVASEASTRASETGTLATNIGTVTTNLGNLTASVTTLSSSVNGVLAKAGVALDVNGYITGWTANNNGTSGDFIIRADKFSVVSPGNPAQAIFDVTASYVRFTGKLLVDGLQTGTLNGDINVGAGRIVFNNGTTMKVTGLGFGTSNQFIEWFGPSMAISACSEATAIQYLKTNGSAYFGGSIAAGVIKNAVQTTNTASNAAVGMGPSSSNGHVRTVVLSYSYGQNWTMGSGNGAAASGTSSATIELYRNGTLIGTVNATGSWSRSAYAGAVAGATFDEFMEGSITITDSSGGTSVDYSAALVSRTTGPTPTVNIRTGGPSQNISILSLEP